MAVAKLNGNTTGQSATGSVSVAQTVNAGGTDVCAFVDVLYDNTAGLSMSPPTLGGVTMVSCGAAAHNATGHEYAESFYLMDPPTGTPTLAITVTGAADIYYTTTVYQGVNRTNPVRPGTYQASALTSDSSGNSSLVVSSNTADLTHTTNNGGSLGAVVTNQTLDGSNTAGNYSGASDHATTAASSVTHTWNGGTTNPIAIVGFSINGDPNGGASFVAPRRNRGPATRHVGRRAIEGSMRGPLSRAFLVIAPATTVERRTLDAFGTKTGSRTVQ